LTERFQGIAERSGDPAHIITSKRIEGATLHYLGDLARARAAMEHVLSESAPSMLVRFGLDDRVSALAHLARVLWLQGFPDQAVRTAGASIEEALAINHANSLCLALCSGACVIAAMTGDLQAADDFTTRLIDCADRHGLEMWQVDGRALRGWVAVQRGDNTAGMQLLRGALHDGHGTRVELRHTIFAQALSEALAGAGRLDESLAVIHKALEESSVAESNWRVPELLRLRGEFALRCHRPADAAAAEKDLLNAFDLAARQGAHSWQLRAATSLARLWQGQGRANKALEMLVPVFDWFTEGFDTADLKAAKMLIKTLRSAK
jgi:predicted ATPase